MFDHFWDFNRSVEGGVQGKAEIMRSRPLFREFWVYVKGMGYRPMVLPMFRPYLQCINRYLGNVGK
jgi:hypothetical protein